MMRTIAARTGSASSTPVYRQRQREDRTPGLARPTHRRPSCGSTSEPSVLHPGEIGTNSRAKHARDCNGEVELGPFCSISMGFRERTGLGSAPGPSGRWMLKNSCAVLNVSTVAPRRQETSRPFADSLIVIDDEHESPSTLIVFRHAHSRREVLISLRTPTRTPKRGAHTSQMGRGCTSGAVSTGRVNWKVTPGPTLREAHIRPP